MEEIDRLYYIYFDREDEGSEFRLIARMNYENNELLYVDLDASCDYTGFDCQGGGTISVSKHPEFFVKNIDTSDDVKNFILEEVKVNKSSISFDIPLKTYRNFISFDSTAKSAIDIYSEIFGALYYQDRFERITTTEEKNDWDYEELQKIKINVEQIDRVYSIFFARDHKGSDFKLVARMDYEGITPLYVELISSGKYGTMKISRNRKFFADEIPEYIKDVILDDNDNDDDKKRKLNSEDNETQQLKKKLMKVKEELKNLEEKEKLLKLNIIKLKNLCE